MTDEIMTIRRVSDQFGLNLGEGALANILGVRTKPFAATVAAINSPRRSTEWSLSAQSGRGDLLVARLGGSDFFPFAPYTAKLPDDLPKRLPLSTTAVSITRATKELGHHAGRQVVH